MADKANNDRGGWKNDELLQMEEGSLEVVAKYQIMRNLVKSK